MGEWYSRTVSLEVAPRLDIEVGLSVDTNSLVLLVSGVRIQRTPSYGLYNYSARFRLYHSSKFS
jgi:catechol-2,3-dioxygenase